MNGSKHLPRINLVNLDTGADPAQKGDGQLAAQMFAEFFQPRHEVRLALGIHMQQFVGV